MAKLAPIFRVPVPTPPRPLGAAGMRLWTAVQETYAVTDTVGIELLGEACAAADRNEALSVRIASDGEVVTDAKGTLRPHPGLAAELANRNFVLRVFDKLGLNYEEKRPGPGRPPKYGD
jgi:hypothetical protein